jgi:hypothetical protein
MADYTDLTILRSTNSNNFSASVSSNYTFDVNGVDEEGTALLLGSLTSKYNVPSSCTLSRGDKNVVQRIFVGEPLKNLCNVFKYNYTSKNWDHEAKIEGSSGEDFGRSLDGTDDAEMVAIGAPGTWFGSSSGTTGKVRVYTKESSGWTQRGSVITKSNGGGFGHAVALSKKDGSILVVGAPFHNTQTPTGFSYPVSEGKVWIYKWNSSTSEYEEEQVISSLSGSLDTISNPTSSTADDWKNFYFGYSLGISNYGKSIIIGEPSFRDIWYQTRHDQALPYTSNVNHKGELNELPNFSSDTDFDFRYTGNAHVFYNSTLTTGGTTWESNVSINEVIGVTKVGLQLDTAPSEVRWMDGVGVSVDINRAGNRILAGSPFSHGTSSTSPQEMSGKIYTLEYTGSSNVWEEMGDTSKNILAGELRSLLGWSARFDGAGDRIVAGAPHQTDEDFVSGSGRVYIFDWNGKQWVSIPNETIEVLGWNSNSTDFREYWHKFGESVSIDGEGEIISISKTNHQKAQGTITSGGGGLRPNVFTVNNITDIGQGNSNIWAYDIQQSLRVDGNCTIGGYLQAKGLAVGTSDDSSSNQKSVYFGGTKSDNSYDLTVIESRVYSGDENSELLLFKGDNKENSGVSGNTHGPDRIRLKAPRITFDVGSVSDTTLTNRTNDDVKFTMQLNEGGSGCLGINKGTPTEPIDVSGKIKCTNGFVGPGTEITGVDLDWILQQNTASTGNPGQTQENMSFCAISSSLSTAIDFPPITGGLTSNNHTDSYGNTWTVTSSRDHTNAWKAFNSSTGNASDGWVTGVNPSEWYYWYINWYAGSEEKISGYRGEWIQLTAPYTFYLSEIEIYTDHGWKQPRVLHIFGSNDNGTNYTFIDTATRDLYWATTSSGYKTPWSRTIDTSVDIAYSTYLLIVGSITVVSGVSAEWRHIKLKGHPTSGTITENIKLDKTGKIGIETTSPEAQLHITRRAPSGESNVYIESYSDGADDLAALYLGTPHHNSSAQPKCAIIADAIGYSCANLHFCVETTGHPNGNDSQYKASLSNSRMMISGQNGNIGIGTSVPSSPLHIAASGNANPDTNSLYVYNSGTASTEDAIVSVRTGTSGGNGGNPYISFDVADHAGWAWGMDNADSQHRMKLGANWNSLTSDTKLAIGKDGKVGINHSTPDSCLHISSSSGQLIELDGTNYTSMIHMNRGSGNWYMATTNTTTWNQNLCWFSNIDDEDNNFPIKRIFRFENDSAGASGMQSGTPYGIISFTGQHVSPVIDVTPTNVSNYTGLIVSSNQNDYLSINTTVPLRGAKNINVNEAIPVVKISTKAQDKACFGVISWGEDPNEERREQKAGHLVNEWNKEKGDNRVYINSIGEGGVWVVNTNGNLEAGDYITTSNVSGYGMKQTSEFLANYTVAKITMDCNFNPGQVPVKQIKKVSATNTYYVRSTDNDTCTETFYNTLDDDRKALYTKDVRTEMVNDLDSNGVFQWEDTSETELAYTIRYLDANGIETTQGNAVHIAAFVGCTYHCG